MPWLTVLTTLLPIVLTPGHPHAAAAQQAIHDAHALSSDSVAPPTGAITSPSAPDKTIEVLTRALQICADASQATGQPLSPTAISIAQMLTSRLAPQTSTTP